jgi:hypothetical protein
LQRLLAEAKCPVETDRNSLALAYSDCYEKDVNRVIDSLKNEFDVTINNQ